MTEIDIEARDAHVAQVLAVDRRDAAQMREREVQRFARGVEHPGSIGMRLTSDVGDDADRVAQVEDARLLRDVAGGEVLAEKAFEIAALGLADHLAGAVVFEPVDHDAVIAEQACISRAVSRRGGRR